VEVVGNMLRLRDIKANSQTKVRFNKAFERKGRNEEKRRIGEEKREKRREEENRRRERELVESYVHLI